MKISLHKANQFLEKLKNPISVVGEVHRFLSTGERSSAVFSGTFPITESAESIHDKLNNELDKIIEKDKEKTDYISDYYNLKCKVFAHNIECGLHYVLAKLEINNKLLKEWESHLVTNTKDFPTIEEVSMLLEACKKSVETSEITISFKAFNEELCKDAIMDLKKKKNALEDEKFKLNTETIEIEFTEATKLFLGI